MKIFHNFFAACFVVMLSAFFSGCATKATPVHDLPPPQPAIPKASFNILKYGAVGDGKTLNTTAIQSAIDDCSKAGGGRVVVPKGDFVTGPFRLASSLDFHLERGAKVLISDDMASYPIEGNRYVDCITASDAHDLKISGEGTIDGQGKKWWAEFRSNPSMTHRPYMIKLSKVERLEVSGVTLQNSPMFHLVPQDCINVYIHGITIHSPSNAANTDGIDPSGWNYFITGCKIDTGDDNIAIKPSGSRSPANKNYRITNMKFLAGHGMSVGSGTRGGLEDMTVNNCTFDGTDSGIRIKSGRGRGGLLQHVTYSNLTMNKVKHPIYIIDFYPERDAPKDPSTEKPEPVTSGTPIDRDILISNVTATNCPTAGIIRGLPEMPVSDITLTNVNISAEVGMKIYHARGIRFVNSQIKAASGDNLTTYDAEVTGLEK